MRFTKRFTIRLLSTSAVMLFTVVVLIEPELFAQSVKGNPKHGQPLFEKHCMECHGRTGDGRGPVGYYLAVEPADFLSIESRMKSDSELISIIKDGIRSDEMHGWEKILSDQDIHDVLSYIRTLAPPLPQ